MASSKSRSRNSRNRSGSPAGSRSAAGARSNGKNSGARTVAAVPATPTSPKKPAGATATRSPKQAAVAPEPEEAYQPAPSRFGPPIWLQVTSLVLAVLGLAISAYETYAHYNGSHLLGCSAKAGGTFDCTAVITSPTSMVFGVIPVALLGLLFYVFAVPIMTPWAWRSRSREIGLARLVSLVVGMAFVLYLIYAELYDIKQVCEYCTGVHIVTFLLFCITVFSAAIWGVGERGHFPAFPGRSRGARR